MPLRLTLKPNEKAIIGGAAIQNGPKGATITINNNVAILREKDVLTEETANTPAKRIYYVVQLMYLDPENPDKKLQDAFLELTRDFMQACPNETVIELIAEIGQHLIAGKYYKALKDCKKLSEYEAKLLNPRA